MSSTRYLNSETEISRESNYMGEETIHSRTSYTGEIDLKGVPLSGVPGGSHYDVLDNILLVCPDETARQQMKQFLESEHYRIIEASWGEEAVALINQDISLVLIDAKSSDTQTELLSRHLLERYPEIPIIVLDEPSSEVARRKSLSRMSFIYIQKPCERYWLLNVISQGCRFSRLCRENRTLRQAIGSPLVPVPLNGNSLPMQTLRKQIESFARMDNTLFITGEPGSGKSLVARLVHQASPRARHPFIIVSCDSIPPEVMEAELFGYIRGAIPGVGGERPGKLQLATRGTLFLDNVDALSSGMQGRILNFLRDHSAQRIGAQDSNLLNTRIIAATSTCIPIACSQGRFREDLYFKLNSLTLNVPSLKDHADDIPAIAREILARLSRENHVNLSIISNGAMNKLRQYTWPGNVREMEAVLLKAVNNSNDTVIGEDDISFDTINGDAMTQQGSIGLAGLTMCEIERRAIIETINACAGNRAKSARKLGLSEKTIYNKIKLYKLRGIV